MQRNLTGIGDIESESEVSPRSETVFTPRDLTFFSRNFCSMEELPLPRGECVYIVATGGTIAGSASSSTSSLYQAATQSAEDLMTSLGDIHTHGSIKTMNLYKIDSSNVTLDHWLLLAKTINELLAKEEVRGVVVTHGTDTLEETAYFLNLVIKSEKPVVLVGSMRASTALSADGPMNLHNAIAVAKSSCRKKGVMVVFNDKIFDARDVVKTNTTRVDAFDAPNSGPIGVVDCGNVNFYHKTIRQHTVKTVFEVEELARLNEHGLFPSVEIIYLSAAGSVDALARAIHQKPILDGLVIAGLGNGNIPDQLHGLLGEARMKGIHVVRSSTTGSGCVTVDSASHLDTDIGLIAGDNLNPKKARILLMLALSKTKHELIIPFMFRAY